MTRDWWDWLPHHPANQKDDDQDNYDLDEEDLINKIEEEVDSLIKLYQKETGEHVNKDDVKLLQLINQLKERLDL